MIATTRSRTNNLAADLNPRVRPMIGGIGRKADDQFGVIPLLPKQPIEHERPFQAARLPPAEPQASVDGSTHARRLSICVRRTPRASQARNKLGQRLAPHRDPDKHK